MSDSEKLLTAEEQDACQKIAASGKGLASQRAAALLAIDQGATRAQASEQAGLTVNQVGYLLRAFRKKHLSMFPDAEPIEGEEQPPEKSTKPEAEASEPKKAKKAKAKKPKKGRKDKDMSKAKKKDKEPKKGKKDKAKKDKAAKKKSKKK
jgi:hypothetical protein